MSQPSPIRFTARVLVLMLGLIVLLGGCAGVDPAPFTQFASSLQPLRAASDTQAGAAVDASRQDLVRQVAAGEVSTADLQLEFDAADPFNAAYGFAESEPNFTKLIRYRQGLAAAGQTQGYIFGVDDVLFRTVAPGDTDGSGELDVLDVAAIINAGKFNNPELGAATWAEGDFNGDDLVNSTDLFLFLAVGRYNQGPYTTSTPPAGPSIADVA